MKKLILKVCAVLAFAAQAQEADVPVLWACKDGKPIALQLLAPMPGVITIEIPADVCKPKAAKPAARPSSSPARST